MCERIFARSLLSLFLSFHLFQFLETLLVFRPVFCSLCSTEFSTDVEIVAGMHIEITDRNNGFIAGQFPKLSREGNCFCPTICYTSATSDTDRLVGE